MLKFDVKEVKLDLVKAIAECSQRGLMHTTKWLVDTLTSFMHKNVLFF